MTREFKKGDRVRLRGYESNGTVASEASAHDLGFIGVKWDKGNGCIGYYHPELLILLKPKRKAREWWVNVYPTGRHVAHETMERADENAVPNRLECVHVREVMSKRKAKELK